MDFTASGSEFSMSIELNYEFGRKKKKKMKEELRVLGTIKTERKRKKERVGSF